MQNQIDNFKAGLKNEIHSSMQNQINSVKNELKSDINKLRNVMASYFQKDTASTLGLGSLPSNIVANQRGDFKGITTRSGVSYDGPPVPPSTSSLPKEAKRVPEVTKDMVQPSTKNIQPPVAQTQVPIDEPVVASKLKPTIAYPSRANKQKLREYIMYEPEVKGMSSSSSSTMNMAFVSSSNNNTSRTNRAVNTAQVVNTANGVSTASTQVNVAYSTNIDNLSVAVICAFFATPTPPTTAPSTFLQDLPNFSSLFGFDHRLKSLKANFSEFVQTNQFAGAVSSIPRIVERYMDQRINKAVKVKVQVSKILLKIKKIVNEQLEAKVLTRSSNSSKTSFVVAADLSEIELKKVMIEKMESNKSIHRLDEQRNL
nr:hypothetical protein [Tanacetum cinerariifolium]